VLDPINVKYFKFAVGSDIGKESENDISAKCIICGDSQKDERQKRLHLYRKSSYENDVVHCFNCSFSGSMYTFLKEVNSVLFEQYRKEKRETSFNSLKNKFQNKDELISPDIDYSYKKKVVSTFEFPEKFIKAESSEEAKKYLNGRCIDEEGIFYSKEDIKIDEKYLPIRDSIVIPLWYKEKDNKVYGFQARAIKDKRFYTYIPEENSGYKVWNWFSIDRDKSVFLFESVFDALSSGLPRDRICAALGADLNEERISEVKDVIFCFDNQFKDNTSREKSLELLEKGHKVFIWPREIKEKDANEWLKNNCGKSFAYIIASNVYSGSKGILKLKLKK